MIIDIEGTDGSGKKTQTDLLCNFLKEKGYKVLKLSFPNYESKSSILVQMYLGGEFGDDVNCLNGYQSSVLYSNDRMLTMKQINADDYDFVICDRYVPSNMIHQSIKVEEDSLVDGFLEWLEDLEYTKLQIPKPDKILFLDMPPEASIKLARARADLKNGQSKDIHEKDDEHLIKAYQRAKYVAEKFNWITIHCVDKEIKSIQEIQEDILTNLNLK